MQINADFGRRAIVHGARSEWLESPMSGVFRKPLDRIGEEVARATTIVKYEPNSKFSPHVHTGGEEFFVLEGTFQDEHGDYPVGSYIRNPPESMHTPGSDVGCVMLVKLWQFAPEDRVHVRLNENFMQTVPHRNIQNVSITPLYKDEREEVSIQYWAANSAVTIDADDGLEVMVIEGDFCEGREKFEALSWIRLPRGASLSATTGSSGTKVWVKRNHLEAVDQQILRINSLK